MPKIFKEMTDNMDYLYRDVLASLGQLPVEKNRLFLELMKRRIWIG